jgi:hypothetical protein
MPASHDDLEISVATSRFRRAVRAIANKERLHPHEPNDRGEAVLDLISSGLQLDAAMTARKDRRNEH